MLRGIVALCSLVAGTILLGSKDEGETLEKTPSNDIYPEDTDSPLSVLRLGDSRSKREFHDNY